ncbi:hypothetical protein FRC06_008151, partial [Ceratobasidium sp. 370]
MGVGVGVGMGMGVGMGVGMGMGMGVGESESESGCPESRASSPDTASHPLGIRTDNGTRRSDDAHCPAPVSAESAASIQTQLSSSLSATLLSSLSSATYRTPYVACHKLCDRSSSPAL